MKPYLIVGAGIAGLSLAFRLEERGIPYVLIDSGNNAGSRVAAGIINPLVFRRLNLSWRVAELIPEAKSFYRKAEKLLRLSFFYSIPIRRAFAHEQERDLWLQKQEEAEFVPYMKKLDEEDDNFSRLVRRCGTGVVQDAWWVDAKLLIDGWQQKLKAKNKLLIQEFDYSKVDPETSVYDGTEYKKIIFCEGYRGRENPWFSYLPLQATKGELLTVKNLFIPENELFNYKCFILPLGEHQFKVGATYQWDSPNTNLTEEAREELENHFQNLAGSPCETLTQEAGVRPTVPDRRPMTGIHPEYTHLAIYNGLGAKGYMISPLLSEEFIAHLTEGKELHPETDIRRYESRYLKT